jgi:hypothetical protein
MKLSFIPKEKKEVLPVVVILECYWVVDWAMTSRFVERSPRDILSTMLSAPQSQALSSTSELSIVQRGDLLIFAVLVPLPRRVSLPNTPMLLVSCLDPGSDRLGGDERS